MFLAKIFCTLLVIQSLQSTFAQDEDDLGPIETLPRFEARRRSSLNDKHDFEYDDDNVSSNGPTNPLPARSGRNNNDNNEDDYDENQAPQSVDTAPQSNNQGPSSTKGQAVSSSGRLGLPRFPVTNQPANVFVAPLPAPTPVASFPAPVAPVRVVSKTNLGKDSSGSLSVPRLVAPLRPNEPTKTVRVVKTARLVRPSPVPVVLDQSSGSLSGLNGGIKSSQVIPTVTRVVRPVLVQRPTTTFVTPVQPVVPAPLPVPVATPFISGSSGPGIVGGVKTVPVFGNSKVQPPRLRVITTQRPTTPAVVDNDEDEDGAAAPGQLSGVKTVATNPLVRVSPVPVAPLVRLTPPRPIAQPIRQPAQVIYADQRSNSQDEDDFDEDDGNSVGQSQPDLIKLSRPLAPSPTRFAPQPYLVPLNVPARPLQPVNVLPSPSAGKVNTIQSTFAVRPQPVPVARQTILTPVAPAPVPVRLNPSPILVDSGSASGSQPVASIKGSSSVVPSVSRFQPRLITTQRPTTQIVNVDDGDDDGSSGPARPQPVLIQTPTPTARPIELVRIRTPPTQQPIVQIRDGALPSELSLPASPRPAQIVQRVRATPAPTARPVVQVTQVRESALPNVQISQPRLVPTAPAPQPFPQVQISQPRLVQTLPDPQPLPQVQETVVFSPLDPNLRPAIPQPSVQLTQVRESAAPQEIVRPQPAQPQQVVQIQQVKQDNEVPASVNTIQVRESAVPITSQGNLGVQQISQPRPVEVSIPAPQPFEILRLREPSFPRFTGGISRPQPLVAVRPRLTPVALPAPANIPTSQSIIQVSQEKEAPLSQSVAPVQVNVVQQPQPQQQLTRVSLPSVQQQQINSASVLPVASNVQFFNPIPQPQRVIRPATRPRLIAQQPFQQFVQISPGSPFSGLPITTSVQNRVAPIAVSQPAPVQVVSVQQQQPTIVVNRPQPTQLVVSNRRPVAPITVSTGSQSTDQTVQIRDGAASVPDEIAQIQQVRLARA